MSKLADKLKRLLLRPERGNGRLGPGRSRGAIPSSKGMAVQAGSDGGDYLDLNEVTDSRKWHPVDYLISSDGFTVIEQERAKQFKMLRNDGKIELHNYQDKPVDPE